MSAKKPPPPADYDEMPELTDEEIAQLRPAREWFAERGIPMPKPVGRPKSDEVKQSVTIRLHPTIVAHFKAQGPGWQTRINEVLLREITKQAG